MKNMQLLKLYQYIKITVLINGIFFLVYGFKLMLDGQEFSHFGFPNALGSSDLTGVIRMSQIYKDSGFLNFYTKYTNYPEGESVFNIYLFSQLSTNLLIHLFNFASPKAVVLILQFIFSSITTLSILILLNLAIKNLFYSSLLAAIFLLSPFNIVNLQAHINGLLWGTPLLAVSVYYAKYLGYKIRKWYLVALFLIAIITDIYLCYAIIFIILTKIIFEMYYSKNTRDSIKKRLKFFLIFSNLKVDKYYKILWLTLSFLALYILSFKQVQYFIESLYDDSIFEPGKTQGLFLLDINLLNIYLVFSAVYFFFILKKLTHADKWLFWVALSFLILSTNIGSFRGHNISPAKILSPLLVGLDHTQRFIPYSVFIFSILYLKCLSKILIKRFQSIRIRQTYFYILVVPFLILRLMYLGGTEHVSDHSLRYEKFRSVIPTNTAILMFPQTISGRDWIQQAYINRPIINSLVSTSKKNEINRISALTPVEIRQYMQNKGTQFLTMPCKNKILWKNTKYGYLNFDKEFKLESVVTDRGYENGPFKVCLFKLAS
jgi:hypothetical protein